MRKGDVRTPGLKWRKRGANNIAYWVCRPNLAALGYPIKTQRLWSGDEPSEADLERIRRECQRLQGEMLDWRKNPATKGTNHWRQAGLIYFMRAGRRVKIGFTTNLKRRLSVVQIGCPEPIELLGTMAGTRAIEKGIHRQFITHHQQGEWFTLASEIVDFITQNGSQTHGEQVGE
jgi:hypothetical protein